METSYRRLASSSTGRPAPHHPAPALDPHPRPTPRRDHPANPCPPTQNGPDARLAPTAPTPTPQPPQHHHRQQHRASQTPDERPHAPPSPAPDRAPARSTRTPKPPHRTHQRPGQPPPPTQVRP